MNLININQQEQIATEMMCWDMCVFNYHIHLLFIICQLTSVSYSNRSHTYVCSSTVESRLS